MAKKCPYLFNKLHHLTRLCIAVFSLLKQVGSIQLCSMMVRAMYKKI